ncbi:spore coat protein [Virgibacillus sp. NKC19-16]|uniref:spore coat protein n=1 Tax=Virgibacillus salidurans TaxID=2831673 RepID=UPI001F22E95C|nr:spore coat protein [Virgibacillus sp. NKC19-16]UJL47341.1 spore coat protein [Virgibacillus sp. NKC19-16]
MRHHHGPHCGCPKKIVHPTKHNCVNQYSESVVQHVHPSHTTVMNHHTVKNQHVYPHSTSMQNTTNSVDEYAGSFNVPAGPGNQVAGAMSPGNGYGPGGQVAGAMSPGGQPHGMGKCNDHNSNHVAGAHSQGNGYGHHGMNHWKKPNKWC